MHCLCTGLFYHLCFLGKAYMYMLPFEEVIFVILCQTILYAGRTSEQSVDRQENMAIAAISPGFLISCWG